MIWAGGISGAPIVGQSGINSGRGGRIDVAADLTVPGHPGVYAIGDVANIPGADGHALPQLGSVAEQSGRWAAKNIHAQLTGQEVTPFHYHDKGIMAMIGRNAAVAEVGQHRHHLEGPLAFVAWLGLHVGAAVRACTAASTPSSTGPTTTSTTTGPPTWNSRTPSAGSPGPTTRPTGRSSDRADQVARTCHISHIRGELIRAGVVDPRGKGS